MVLMIRLLNGDQISTTGRVLSWSIIEAVRSAKVTALSTNALNTAFIRTSSCCDQHPNEALKPSMKDGFLILMKYWESLWVINPDVVILQIPALARRHLRLHNQFVPG